MILKKVALPLALDGNHTGGQWYKQSQTTSSAHWGQTSCKSCLSSFKVIFILYKHGNGSVTIMRYLSMDKSLAQNCSGSSRNSSPVMYGIHFKIIGNCIKRNIMPERGTWGGMWGKWQRWLVNKHARWRWDWWCWGSECRWWLTTSQK